MIHKLQRDGSEGRAAETRPPRGCQTTGVGGMLAYSPRYLLAASPSLFGYAGLTSSTVFW